MPRNAIKSATWDDTKDAAWDATSNDTWIATRVHKSRVTRIATWAIRNTTWDATKAALDRELAT